MSVGLPTNWLAYELAYLWKGIEKCRGFCPGQSRGKSGCGVGVTAQAE